MAERTGLYYPTKDEFNYSTSEEVCAGTWVDGKTIYRKTIDFGALPNNTSKSVAHGISNLDYVVKMEGIATDGDRAFPLPSAYPPDSGSDIRIIRSGDSIVIHTGMDRSSFTAYVTMYYTKNEAEES